MRRQPIALSPHKCTAIAASCHRQNRPSAAAWRGAVTRGDCRSRHFGTAVAVQAVKCRALSAVPRRAVRAAWHKITALNAAQLLVQVG